MAKSLDDLEWELLKIRESVRKLEAMNNKNRFTWNPIDNITFELEAPSWNPLSMEDTKEALRLPNNKKNGKPKRKRRKM